MSQSRQGFSSQSQSFPPELRAAKEGASQPQFSDWEAELDHVLQSCLQEIRTVEATLKELAGRSRGAGTVRATAVAGECASVREVATSLAASALPSAEHVPAKTDAGESFSPVLPKAPASAPSPFDQAVTESCEESVTEDDFDARLARLKRLLAQKLTQTGRSEF